MHLIINHAGDQIIPIDVENVRIRIRNMGGYFFNSAVMNQHIRKKGSAFIDYFSINK